MSAQHPHTAKTVFFGCMDDRLCSTDNDFIASLDGGAFHPSLAGGAAAILSDEDRATALKQIVAAYKINQISAVYIQSHTNCGAYALAGVTFANADEEQTRLRHDLEEAAKIVGAALHDAGAQDGDVTVHTRLVDPSGQLI